MTEYLVKLFVKNNENLQNQTVRTSYGVLASIVGFISNVILFVIKLTVGILINSVSVMADAFNNLSDGASSVIGYFGVKLAGRPADKEHPFGHGRLEYITALGVSFIILQVGLTLFKSSFTKILKPETIKFNPILIGILILTILVKIWLMIFNRKLGKRIKSNVLLATATDSMGDVIVTSATVVSTIIAGVTGWQIDGYMGLVVSVFVMIAGIGIAKDTLEPLLGQAVDREAYKNLTALVEGYPGIVGTHDLIIHNYGPSYRMATIHAEVPNDIDFQEAHETIDKIERDVLEILDIFLVIHMDPVEMNDVMVLEKRDLVSEIIKTLDESASFHDFRVVNGEYQINLIFEMVIPFSYTQEDAQKLLQRITEELRKHDTRLNCVITLENSFIAEE
jgi:cation diffusion facilitator family transporter